jgi:hypothetical protein
MKFFILERLKKDLEFGSGDTISTSINDTLTDSSVERSTCWRSVFTAAAVF